MAKKPKKRQLAAGETQMDMTPMIDCTFQLIIFFIISLRFKVLENKLVSHLPTNFGSATSSQFIDEKFLTVTLRQRGTDVDDRPLLRRGTLYEIEGQSIGGTEDEVVAAIDARIAKFKTDVPEAKGKISTMPGVPHERVVRILDLFHKSGYEMITVALGSTAGIEDPEFRRVIGELEKK